MSQENTHHLYAIGAFRMVGGLSVWLTPDLVGRVYGGAALPAESLLWSRLAGSREIALAVGPILSKLEDRRRWLMLGLACDLADMTATLVGNRKRDRVSSRSTILAMATYSVSALLTMWALEAAGPRE